MNPAKSRIFISYSNEDKAIVEEICKVFKSKYIDYIIDHTHFHSGDSIQQQIRAKIDSATHFLVIFTPNSSSSHWVDYEIEYSELQAINKKIELLAFKIDDVVVKEETKKKLLHAIIEPINSNAIVENINSFLAKNNQIIGTIDIESHLLKSQIEIIDVHENDYLSERELVWLVVPRKKMTVIHLAQIELIKQLLIICNWSLKIIYINLGSKDIDINVSDDNRKFAELIKLQLNIKGVLDKCSDVLYLTDFFTLNEDDNKGNSFFMEFIGVARKMEIKKLLEIFNKQYSKSVQEKQLEKPVINLLRPFMSITFAKLFVEEKNSVIFIAGADEEKQWEYLVGNLELPSGVMLIPTLEMDDENDTKQDAKTTQYTSVDKLIEYFGKGNNFYWVLSMFILLPNLKLSNNLPPIIQKLLTTEIDDIKELKNKGKNSKLYKDYQPHFSEIAKFVYPMVGNPRK